MLFIGLMLKNKMFYAASAEKILELCGTFQNYWKLHLLSFSNTLEKVLITISQSKIIIT